MVANMVRPRPMPTTMPMPCPMNCLDGAEEAVDVGAEDVLLDTLLLGNSNDEGLVGGGSVGVGRMTDVVVELSGTVKVSGPMSRRENEGVGINVIVMVVVSAWGRLRSAMTPTEALKNAVMAALSVDMVTFAVELVDVEVMIYIEKACTWMNI